MEEDQITLTFDKTTVTGAELRDLRNQHQLTVRKVAAKAGLNYAALSRFENGHHQPKTEAVEQILTAIRDLAAERKRLRKLVDEVRGE